MKVGIINISREDLGTSFECEHQKFETEDAALVYAAKLATLNEGDHVLFMKDGQAIRAIFQGFVNGGTGVRLIAYNPETKEVIQGEMCSLQLRFPEVH